MKIQDLNILEPLSVEELNQVVGGKRRFRGKFRRFFNYWRKKKDPDIVAGPDFGSGIGPDVPVN